MLRPGEAAGPHITPEHCERCRTAHNYTDQLGRVTVKSGPLGDVHVRFSHFESRLRDREVPVHPSLLVEIDATEAASLEERSRVRREQETQLDFFLSMFPGLGRGLIHDVLSANSQDVGQTMDHLLLLVSDDSAPSPQQGAGDPQSRVCCPHTVVHEMQEFLATAEGFSCDYCMEELEARSAMFGCRYCNIDACQRCVVSMRGAGQLRDGRLPPPPPKPGLIEALVRASYGEVEVATRQWSTEILGRGVFGVVHRGTWRERAVAVKKCELSFGLTETQARQQFDQELEVLTVCRHQHIVPLLAYCVEQSRPLCLVYPLMERGALSEIIRHERSRADLLPAATRCRITREVATGLEYLHTAIEGIRKPCIIHRDVKTANVLLDSGMRARLGDVGISREVRPSHVTQTAPMGTLGYTDPEYMETGIMTPECDIFSFGVVLLELLTGQPAYDSSKSPPNLVRRLRGSLPAASVEVACRAAQFPDDMARSLGDLAKQCTLRDPADRAQLPVVVSELQGLLDSVPAAQAVASEEARVRDCAVCLDAPVETRLVPCMHAVLCQTHAEELMRRRAPCPMCRTPIQRFDIGDFAMEATFLWP